MDTACERPLTGANADKPAAMNDKGTPAASAQAAAAKAFLTLCRPAICRETPSGPAGVCDSTSHLSPLQSALAVTSAGPDSAKVNTRREPARPRQTAV